MVILASQSPRRKQLLSKIYKDFLILPSDIDETPLPNATPLEATKDIAYRKGEKIHQEHKDDIVISADTIVVIDNTIIGKPKDKEDAKRILNLLSNREHQVITAYTIFNKDIVIANEVISYVQFNLLNDDLINRYILSGSPMDKAGAYGLQDNDTFPIVKEVKGSISNIIGFPIEEIKKDLRKNNLL